jgi:tetratricopeptide (TPR) repeat protein
LAKAAHKFAIHLHEKEYFYYTPPLFLKSLEPTTEKFSCFCHWKDLYLFKELLLLRAVEEHIKVVKCEPTNLEVHAALANAYVMLSSLYADPRKYDGFDEERWIPQERYSENMKEKFRITAERAIEEFKILNDYAPDDPWVHIQLAYSYHDLLMPEQEIKEYEIVLKLRPDDKETLFKLGMLYFQQGKNAQGLRIYEMLKQTNYKKAENLIKFYGAYEISYF